jgi:hypothetical protein
MEECRKMEIRLHSFSNLSLVGGKCSSSCPGRFNPKKSNASEASWASKQVWALWWGEKSIYYVWDRTPDHHAHCLRHYTNYAPFCSYVSLRMRFSLFLYARSQNCEKRLLVSSCPSIRMKKLGCQQIDFDETTYLSLFRTSFEKIRVPLKSDNNNGYSTWRRFHIYDNISLSSS